MVNLVVPDHPQTMYRTLGLKVKCLLHPVSFDVSLELQHGAIHQKRRKSNFLNQCQKNARLST